MRDLWPPLHEIERRTRPVPDGLSLVDNPIAQDLSGDHPEPSPPLPDFLSSLIERGIAANRQASELREGAVVLYTPEPKDKPGLAPFAFCLNRLLSRQGQNEKWLGWVASPDVDYAGPYDVVLEPHDEPFDPFAGMIQTWNPLVLTLRAPMRLLAQLSMDRVRLMRAVEQQAVSGGGNASPSRPGHIELRSTGPESILTGTMLGGSTDPRTQYAAIYRALASEFQPRAANDGSWFGIQRKQWYGIAATVVAGIGALVLYGSINQEMDSDLRVASGDKPAAVLAKTIEPKPELSEQATQLASASAAQERSVETPLGKVKPPSEKAKPVESIPQKPLSTNPKERTELATAKILKQTQQPESSAQAMVKGDENSTSSNASTELASIFLMPIEGQPFQIALRGGDKRSESLHLYRLHLKKAANVEDALMLLESLGLKIIKIEETKGVIELVADKQVITPELDRKLKGSSLFIETKAK